MTSENTPFDILDAVRACHFLSNAGDQLVRPIAAISKVIRQPRGTLVFDEGDPCRGMFIVHSGAIKLFKTGPDGREHVLHVVGPGDCFGEAAMFLGMGYPAAAEAVRDSTLVLVSKEKFLGLLEREPALCFQMMGTMALWARRLVDKVEILTLKDASARLAQYLLKHASASEGCRECVSCVQLSIPKNVLASQLGISNETLSRLLAKFEAQGLISAQGRRVNLLNSDELAELAEFGSS